MVQLSFDARAVEPRMGFDPIPSGWYKAMITEADLKPTRAGTGSFLNIQFSVLEGQFQNMKVFARLNIDNPNAQAKEIAFRELSTICHAIGIQVLQDSEELKNKPMFIRVKKRTGQKNAETGEEYDDSNDIKSYKNINDTTVLTGTTAAPVTGVVIPAAAAPVTAAAPAVAAPVALPPVAAAPVLDPSYQYTPDNTHRWKVGMAAWEPVPAAAPPAPPPPPGGAVAGGWQAAPAQPWAAAAAAPVVAAAPVAPPAPPAVTGAKPPWST